MKELFLSKPLLQGRHFKIKIIAIKDTLVKSENTKREPNPQVWAIFPSKGFVIRSTLHRFGLHSNTSLKISSITSIFSVRTGEKKIKLSFFDILLCLHLH